MLRVSDVETRCFASPRPRREKETRCLASLRFPTRASALPGYACLISVC
ncbi:MAG: hypothetical protein VSS75_008580 [Candidatus Parabeggiatoa sp.]|nr:hypothetical protein [Candidatus Parabeggiatoa sp.]